MTFDFVETQFRKFPKCCKKSGFIRWNRQICGAEDERLVAFIGATVEEICGLGVGAGDNDAGHAHDVELETRSVEALDLLVFANENLAALMAALFHAGLLVFDVVAGYASFHKSAN